MNVGVEKNKNDIAKKPWWYLFFISNILVILGCAITYFLFKKIDSGVQLFQHLFIPTLVCNFLSFLILFFFVFLEYRDIIPKQMHFQRKWIYIYIVSICIFILAIIFSTIFFIFIRDKWVVWNNTSFKKNMLIIYLVIPVLLTLLSVGINRYARFRIDLDVYRRKHGQSYSDKKDLKQSN